MNLLTLHYAVLNKPVVYKPKYAFHAFINIWLNVEKYVCDTYCEKYLADCLYKQIFTSIYTHIDKSNYVFIFEYTWIIDLVRNKYIICWWNINEEIDYAMLLINKHV